MSCENDESEVWLPVKKKYVKSMLNESVVGRLAFDGPYVIPVCYVYHQGKIYIHCQLKGKKIDLLKKNPEVCFEIDAFDPLVLVGLSTLFFGKIAIVTDQQERSLAFNLLAKKYPAHCSKNNYTAQEAQSIPALILAVKIEHLSCCRYISGERFVQKVAFDSIVEIFEE
jgi:hypothetical protein